jgi:hypothetical protein
LIKKYEKGAMVEMWDGRGKSDGYGIAGKERVRAGVMDMAFFRTRRKGQWA